MSSILYIFKYYSYHCIKFYLIKIRDEKKIEDSLIDGVREIK